MNLLRPATVVVALMLGQGLAVAASANEAGDQVFADRAPWTLDQGPLVWRLTGIAFGKPSPSVVDAGKRPSMLPLIIHLLLVLIAGLYLPGPLVAWFQNVARMLG